MSTVQIIDPQGSTPRDWCDRMVLELEQFGTIPILVREMSWKDWGRQVISLPEISRFDPPSPELFGDNDFVEWATYFNDAVAGNRA